MATKLTPEDISGKLLQGSFQRPGPAPQRLADPIADTPMVLTIDEVAPYDSNPRTAKNPKYDEIKASIRARGLDQAPPVTRRPGEDKYIIRNGGNTRLSILRELWSETKEERFYRFNCLYKPWAGARGEIIALTGHLAENDLHGQLMFIERAVGIDNARALYEQETGQQISQRELSRRLKDDGYPISQSHISKMQDTVRCLLPVIPQVLYSGLGKPQIERLLSLRKSASQTWESNVAPEAAAMGFDMLFQDVLSQFDGDASEFVYERFQDELIGQMKADTGLSYEQILLDITENQNLARRSAPLETPQPLAALPITAASNAAAVEQDEVPPQVPATTGAIAAPTNKKQRTTTDTTPPATTPQIEMSEDERLERLAAHTVSPVSARTQEIKRQVAQLDGETLPDFQTNALVSIPVQAGGLHPISDVWYVERALDTPSELRVVIAQLAREIAVLSGLPAEAVVDAPAGLGFVCPEPPAEIELSYLANNTLTLLQAVCGQYAIALSEQTPEQPLDIAEFQFTAALGQLVMGTPRFKEEQASIEGRLDDVAIVKLFRLIRLGRRLVEIESQVAHGADAP